MSMRNEKKNSNLLVTRQTQLPCSHGGALPNAKTAHRSAHLNPLLAIQSSNLMPINVGAKAPVTAAVMGATILLSRTGQWQWQRVAISGL